MYCTAVGKCLICNLPVKELFELLEKVDLRKYTENTIVNIESIEKELRKVEQQGFAYDLEEYENYVHFIASPICSFEGKIEAAIGISGPKDRILADMERLTEEVLLAGKEISRILGSKKGFSE